MNCRTCGTTLDPFSLPKIGKKYDDRCESCRNTKTESSPRNAPGSTRTEEKAESEEELVFTAIRAPAVAVRIDTKEWQGHTWFGATEKEALARCRTTVHMRYKSHKHINVELE